MLMHSRTQVTDKLLHLHITVSEWTEKKYFKKKTYLFTLGSLSILFVYLVYGTFRFKFHQQICWKVCEYHANLIVGVLPQSQKIEINMEFDILASKFSR